MYGIVHSRARPFVHAMVCCLTFMWHNRISVSYVKYHFHLPKTGTCIVNNHSAVRPHTMSTFTSLHEAIDAARQTLNTQSERLNEPPGYDVFAARSSGGDVGH